MIMGGDSCSKGRGFEFQHCILDIHDKRGRGQPILKTKFKCSIAGVLINKHINSHLFKLQQQTALFQCSIAMLKSAYDFRSFSVTRKKSPNVYRKLPKNDFTRKMIDFDIYKNWLRI